MEINELLEIAKKGNLTDCGQRKCADIIEAQQQEIEQLRADKSKMGEALIKADNYVFDNLSVDEKDWDKIQGAKEIQGIMGQALTASEPYHNPEDIARIEALTADKDEQADEIGRLQMTVDLLIGKVEALTADKDERAGRIMKLDNGLIRLKLSLQWLYEINTNRWYKEWTKEKIAEIDALIGGKESD